MDLTIHTSSQAFSSTAKEAHKEIKSRLRWYFNELKKSYPGDEFPSRSMGLVYANWHSTIAGLDFCLSDGILPSSDIARIDNQVLFNLTAAFTANFLASFCEGQEHEIYVYYLTISQQLFGQDQDYIDFWSRNSPVRLSPFAVIDECFRGFTVDKNDLPRIMDLRAVLSQHTKTVYGFISIPTWTEEALESFYT